jgi:hypothetical protein
LFPRNRRRRRSVILTAGLVATAFLTVAVTAAAPGYGATAGQVPIHGSLGPQNPFMAAGGTGTPHNTAQSTDTTAQPGPGAGPVTSTMVLPGTSCPSILLDHEGYVIAYCLNQVLANYTFVYGLRLLTPDGTTVLATLSLPPTGQYDVYFYLDQQDRIVLGTGDGHILRIAHWRTADGDWHLGIVNDWNISNAVTSHCGGVPGCDYILSVKPDWTGRIWFATTYGVAGTLNPDNGAVAATTLPAGERITKDISSSPAGVAVVSDHALYLFQAGPAGTPELAWREPYSRGSGVKPGQLIDGTGTSPSFFGSGTNRYVTIIDNAVPRENLLVYRVGGAENNRLVCTVPLFQPGASATDDTSMAVGDTVIAVNTYGYNYFGGTAALPGGMTRVDVRDDGSGCEVKWTNTVATIVMPKLSVQTGYIYTIERTATATGPAYSFVVIDPQNGDTVRTTFLGSSPQVDEGLQYDGMLTPDGADFQSTVAGIFRISPSSAP